MVPSWICLLAWFAGLMVGLGVRGLLGRSRGYAGDLGDRLGGMRADIGDLCEKVVDLSEAHEITFLSTDQRLGALDRNLQGERSHKELLAEEVYRRLGAVEAKVESLGRVVAGPAEDVVS